MFTNVSKGEVAKKADQPKQAVDKAKKDASGSAKKTAAGNPKYKAEIPPKSGDGAGPVVVIKKIKEGDATAKIDQALEANLAALASTPKATVSAEPPPKKPATPKVITRLGTIT